MQIKPFAVEEWMNAHEAGAIYDIAETCVNSISLDELFELTGTDKYSFLDAFSERRLTYGYITGNPDFKNGVCKLYTTMTPEKIIPTHGAAGANHHVFLSLIEPKDKVISIMPTYQQLYSIPESLGADVHALQLKREEGYMPNLEKLEALATPDTKMICINNPNNPTGALIPRDHLEQIVKIARRIDAYLLCDEVYRHLTQESISCPSIADLYDKGISVGSMSKVFSLAGLRLGWIATHDEAAKQAFMSHRDYNLISCGMFDEAVASLALTHSHAVLSRAHNIVRENLSILNTWIVRQEHFSYVKPKAGTTALVYYDFNIPSYEFCERLYSKTGAFVTPGDCFEEPHSFRIGYASQKEQLIAGLEAISDFAKAL